MDPGIFIAAGVSDEILRLIAVQAVGQIESLGWIAAVGAGTVFMHHLPIG